MAENLGELISYIRTRIFGLSLLDFSELMNQSSSALQRYENNDFGVKFNKNKHIKIKDLSEKIASIVFDEHKIIRKTKNFYINSNMTKIEYNIKEKLLNIYKTKNPSQIMQITKLESIDALNKEGLTEFLYTYFLYFIGMTVIEKASFSENYGFIKIVDTNKDRVSDYKKCLMEASGTVFITGTSMISLSEDSGDLLIEKATNGKVQLLILDPYWIEVNSQILTFLEYEEDRREFSFEIRNSIRKLNALKRKLPPSMKPNMTIKSYKTLFPYIITGYENKKENTGKMVVEITDYMPEKFRPRFTLQKNSHNNNLYNIIKKKFYSLWNNTNLTREV